VLMVFLLPPMRRHKSQSRVRSIGAGVTQKHIHALPNFSFYLCDTRAALFWRAPGLVFLHLLETLQSRRFLGCVRVLSPPVCVCAFGNNFTFIQERETDSHLSLDVFSFSLVFACKHVPICLFPCVCVSAVDAPRAQ
jgi:hypothetical protein